MQLSGKAGLRGAPLLTFRGVATLDGRRLFDGDGWNRAPGLDVDVPGYAGELRNLQPRLHAIDGSCTRAPAARQLRRARLPRHRRGTQRRARAGRFASLMATRALSRALDVRHHRARAGGGEVHVAGELPRDWDEPMRIGIDTRALDMGFLGALWEEIGEAGGRLDAHVQVEGSRTSRTRRRARSTTGASASAATRALRGRSSCASTAMSAADATSCAAATARSRRRAGAPGGLMPTELRCRRRASVRGRLRLGRSALRRRLRLSGDRATNRSTANSRCRAAQIALPELAGLGAAEESAVCPTSASTTPASATRGGGARRQGRLRRRARRRADGAAQQGGRARPRRRARRNLRRRRLAIEGVVEASAAASSCSASATRSSARSSRSAAARRSRAALAHDPAVGKATVAVVIEGTAKNPQVRLSCEPPVYDGRS